MFKIVFNNKIIPNKNIIVDQNYNNVSIQLKILEFFLIFHL